MGAERLENLVDARIISPPGKLKSAPPRNAQFVLDVVRQERPARRLIADCPLAISLALKIPGQTG
jgi:hypothetical protein